MKKFIFLIVSIIFLAISLVSVNAETIVTGKIYNSTILIDENSVSNAFVVVGCYHGILTYTKETISISDGTYGVRFNNTECGLGDNVNVAAYKGNLKGSNTGIVHYETEMNISVVNVVINVTTEYVPDCGRGKEAKKVYELTLIADDSKYAGIFNISNLSWVPPFYDGEEGTYIGVFKDGAYSVWNRDTVNTTKWGGGPGLTWKVPIYTLILTDSFQSDKYGNRKLIFIGKYKLFATPEEAEARSRNRETKFEHEGGPIYFWINDKPITDNRGNVTMELFYCEKEKHRENNGEIRFIGEGICNENWECSGWSECSDGIMTRQCNDLSECGTEFNKPIEATGCEKGVTQQALEEPTKINPWLWIGILIALILIIFLIIVSVRR